MHSFLLTKEIHFESMSDTMSSPGDWAQFYQQNVSASGQMVPPSRLSSGIDPVSEAVTVTTTINSTNLLSSSPSSAPSSSNIGNLSPEGRVSKPIRRRSRASRRTPTTLLNTDTTNFRAMVQQFTGGPSAPFASGPNPGGTTGYNFGLGGARQGHVNPGTVMMPPGYRLQYQLQQPQQQQYQQQHQGYMISLGNNNNPGPGDGFFQRLGSNPRPNMEVSDGFVMENVSALGAAPQRAPNSNENRGNTFMF